MYEPSPNPMSLTLPSVLREPMPRYAVLINDALTSIGAHDHSTGKGSQLTPLALNINEDLDIQGHNLDNVRALRLDSQVEELPATASEASSVYVKDGDLYFANGQSASVQITDGPSVVAAGGDGIDGDYSTSPASIFYDEPTSTYRFLRLPGLRAFMQSNSLDIQNDQGAPALTLGTASMTQQASNTLQLSAAEVLAQNPASPATLTRMRLKHGTGAGGVVVETTTTGATVSMSPSNVTNMLTMDGTKIGILGPVAGSSNVAINSSLKVTGAVIADTTVDVVGALSAAGITSTANISASGTLSVANGATLGGVAMTQGLEMIANGGTCFIDMAATTGVDFDWRISVDPGFSKALTVIPRIGGTGFPTPVVRLSNILLVQNTHGRYSSVLSSYPHALGPAFYYETTGAATATILSTPIVASGGAAVRIPWQAVAPNSGGIVAISVGLNNTVPTITTWVVRVNGTPTGASVAVPANSFSGSAVFAKTAFLFAAGATLTMQMTPTAGTINMAATAYAWVEFD